MPHTLGAGTLLALPVIVTLGALCLCLLCLLLLPYEEILVSSGFKV